ncbi:hypothetical protein [Alkalihalobacillus sp. 1P02AB]|uniref:hypothetical protein n=1 Tax=Alkalihalobacillus sp. 1P02AB TaxID=3132260 RepID=UPI0039A552BB
MVLKLTDTKTLAVKELCYECIMGDRITEIPKEQFSLSVGKLATGIGRTIISQNINCSNQRYITLSALYLLKALVLDSNTKLLLMDEAKQYLRDFSLTGRIGEIAQGINYIFFQERLNYIEIIDYYEFIKNHTNAKPKGSPDFIMMTSLGQYVILESKGSWINHQRTNLKSTIKKGLEQCQKGNMWLEDKLKFLMVSKVYTSVVRLKDDINKQSELIYVDPKYNDKVNKKPEITLLHYSTWFYFIGLNTIAVNLKELKWLNSNDIKNIKLTQEQINGIEFVLFDKTSTVSNYLNCLFACESKRINIQFGLSKNIWDFLFNGKGFEDNERKELFNLKPFSGKEYELFRDGTIIKYN